MERSIDVNTGIQCFSDDGLEDCYPRTKGLLKVVDDELIFESSSLLGKDHQYPLGRDGLSIVDGTLYSTVTIRIDDRNETLLVLSPAYNGHEEALATALHCSVEPSSIIKGFRVGIEYIKGQYNTLMNSRKTSSTA